MELRGGHQATGPTPTPTSIASTPPHPPVTPQAVMSLLAHHKVDLAGKRVLVLGRSRIVGQPLAYMLTTQNALVSIAHSGTPLELLAAAVKVDRDNRAWVLVIRVEDSSLTCHSSFPALALAPLFRLPSLLTFLVQPYTSITFLVPLFSFTPIPRSPL